MSETESGLALIVCLLAKATGSIDEEKFQKALRIIQDDLEG